MGCIWLELPNYQYLLEATYTKSGFFVTSCNYLARLEMFQAIGIDVLVHYKQHKRTAYAGYTVIKQITCQ